MGHETQDTSALRLFHKHRQALGMPEMLGIQPGYIKDVIVSRNVGPPRYLSWCAIPISMIYECL